MKTSKIYSFIFLIFLVTGCSSIISINDSVHLKNKREILEKAGNPHEVKKNSNGDEWIYNFSSFSMINFEKRTYYYRYLIDDKGQIVEQTAMENIYRPFNLFAESPEDWFEKCLNEQGHKFTLDFTEFFCITN